MVVRCHPGKPLTQRRFAFKAFPGRYADENWQSTVAIRNGKIAAGSLPNLLFLMSKWSGDRIQTNERNVEAIPLESPALLADRPPFAPDGHEQKALTAHLNQHPTQNRRPHFHRKYSQPYFPPTQNPQAVRGFRFPGRADCKESCENIRGAGRRENCVSR